MSIKDFLKNMLSTYFIIVTLINAEMLIVGVSAFPDEKFGYDAFLAPLAYGLAGVLPMIVLYSKKELSVKQIIIRKIIQYFMIVFLVAFAFKGNLSFVFKDVGYLVLIALSVLVVYALVHVILWILDSKKAKDMMLDLEKFQNR